MKKKPTFREALKVIAACRPAQDWVHMHYVHFKPRHASKYWKMCPRRDWMVWLVARTFNREERAALCTRILERHPTLNKIAEEKEGFREVLSRAIQFGVSSKSYNHLIHEITGDVRYLWYNIAGDLYNLRDFYVASEYLSLLWTIESMGFTAGMVRELVPWSTVEYALVREMRRELRKRK